MGGLKDELLKAIWHAFTALDLDRSGKVSKSQLKVSSGPPLLGGLGGRAPRRCPRGRVAGSAAGRRSSLFFLASVGRARRLRCAERPLEKG